METAQKHTEFLFTFVPYNRVKGIAVCLVGCHPAPFEIISVGTGVDPEFRLVNVFLMIEPHHCLVFFIRRAFGMGVNHHIETVKSACIGFGAENNIVLAGVVFLIHP